MRLPSTLITRAYILSYTILDPVKPVCCVASALQRDLFAVPSRRSVFVRLNEILFARFQLSGSAQDDSTPLFSAGASPRIIARRQNAETPGERYRLYPLGEREGLNRYFGAVKSLRKTS